MSLLLQAGGEAPRIGPGWPCCGGSQTVTSSLRRILVPGSTSQPAIQESLLGVFGHVNGKNTRLSVNLGSGRSAIFTLTGNGTGTALQAGNDIHLEITASKGATLTVKVIGGGTVSLSNIDVTGSLVAIHAPAAVVDGNVTATGSLGVVAIGDLKGDVTVTGNVGTLTTGSVVGTLSVGGNLGHLKAGNISGKVVVTGNILNIAAGNVSGEIYAGGNLLHAKVGAVTGLVAAASQLASLTATSLSSATIIAGAALPNGVLDLSGGTDTFGAGTIGTLHVNGIISSSFIGAGVNPVDGAFGNGNDTSAGTSVIKTVVVKGGADAATHFEASAFGTARLPMKVVVTTNPKFIVL